MTTTISKTPTGFPNRRSSDAVDANQLSKKEFRQLVEVLRLRDEVFFVIELRSPLRDDLRKLLVTLRKSGASGWSTGWLGRNRLGIVGHESQTAKSVQRWFAKNGSAAQGLRIYFHDGGHRDHETKQKRRLAFRRNVRDKNCGPLSSFADNPSSPQRARLPRQQRKAGRGISGNGQPEQREMFYLGKNIQPTYDIYKIRTPIGKRCFDIAFAILVLVLATPLLCLSAALIKITSRGPLFFVQDRVGHGGKPFRMYKFRTMRIDADNSKHQLAEQNEMNGSAFKMCHDPRVTWVGTWLRRLSIDEIPQLWNVIRGDMSLVGPRPLPVADWTPGSVRELYRHDVVPGLTCIWQIMGRNEIAWEEWVRMDLFYVRKRCWRLDARILLATVPAVLSQRGAY